MAIKRRGISIEEGALRAMGVTFKRTPSEFRDWLSTSRPRMSVHVGQGEELICTVDNNDEIIVCLEDLIEEICQELALADEVTEFYSGMRDYRQPDESTTLNVFKLHFNETSYNEEFIDFRRSMVTPESLYAWLLEQEEEAILLDLIMLIMPMKQ